jgi:hypothetical protein
VAEPTPLRCGELNVPGIVTRGFTAVDPELQRTAFKIPGTNGTIVKTFGLHERPIVVPMLAHSASWRRYNDVHAFLRRLEAFKGQGKQVTLQVPTIDGSQVFESCYLARYEPDPDGPREDVLGTIGGDSATTRWFIKLLLIFHQVLPAR